jgi:hypothetical protein
MATRYVQGQHVAQHRHARAHLLYADDSRESRITALIIDELKTLSPLPFLPALAAG